MGAAEIGVDMDMDVEEIDVEEIGHHKRQTNRRAVVPIVGVVWVNACTKVEVVGVVVVRVWSR